MVTVSAQLDYKTQSKIAAIVEAPRPHDVSQLSAFLGLVNYYNRFLPNPSSLLVPLYKLLQKQAKWDWSTSCDNTFEEIKQLIALDLVLTHFNPDLPLLQLCDASPHGLGAVLSHTCANQLHLFLGPYPPPKITTHR